MILAALVLVLAGAGLFGAGILTGVEPYYWACVAACTAAAVLLVLARRRMPAAPPASTDARPGGEPAEKSGEPAAAPEPVVEEAPQELADPQVEDVEVTDLLLVVDLKDEVLVVDERPRYHLAGCVHLKGRTPIPLPHDEARADGFTPCGVCEPDHTLAEQVRARKAARGT